MPTPPYVDLINTFLVARGHGYVADKRRTRAPQARTAPACLGDMCFSTVKPGHTCPCGGRGATDPCERAQRVHWRGRCRVSTRRRCCRGPNLAASPGLFRQKLVWRGRKVWGRPGGLPPTAQRCTSHWPVCCTGVPSGAGIYVTALGIVSVW